MIDGSNARYTVQPIKSARKISSVTRMSAHSRFAKSRISERLRQNTHTEMLPSTMSNPTIPIRTLGTICALLSIQDKYPSSKIPNGLEIE